MWQEEGSGGRAKRWLKAANCKPVERCPKGQVRQIWWSVGRGADGAKIPQYKMVRDSEQSQGDKEQVTRGQTQSEEMERTKRWEQYCQNNVELFLRVKCSTLWECWRPHTWRKEKNVNVDLFWLSLLVLMDNYRKFKVILQTTKIIS